MSVRLLLPDRHSKSRIQAIEAQIRALQRDVDVLQRQRIRDEDRLTNHIQHEHDRFKELKMPPKSIAETTTPMTHIQIKALIAQGVAMALAEYEATRDSGVGNALTWWNSHVKTVSHEVAYGMTWKALKKMMTDKYCPRGEIKKLEIELWYLKVKGTDVLSYNQCFQELALMCSRMFLGESDEIEKYDAIEFSTELMDQKICTFADCQAENKRKLDDNSRNNQNQQQPFKRQNVAMAYTARPGEKKVYGGSKPLCPKRNYHHNGQCAPKCTNCKRTGHLAQDCRSLLALSLLS
ncbi:putative reverse transcriptase domain-containing protein [Tanacetum coccineum]